MKDYYKMIDGKAIDIDVYNKHKIELLLESIQINYRLKRNEKTD